MPTRNQSIETFEFNMDELISCRYVLSANKISLLLKGISQSKLLYSLFRYCLNGFDYQAEKSLYFTEDSVSGEKKFLFPPEKKTALALIFSLLFEIDGGEINFTNLLNEYFTEKELKLSYERFGREVLFPFKLITVEVAEQMIASRTEEKYQPEFKEVAPKKRAILSDEDINDIIALLDQSKGVILQYKIDADKKAELIALYDYFRSALYDSEVDLIKSTYLGYKYGILFHRKNDSSIEKIADILRKDGVL